MALGIKPILIITTVVIAGTIVLILNRSLLFRFLSPTEASLIENQDEHHQMLSRCIIAFAKARSTWVFIFAIAIVIWIYIELGPSLYKIATSVTPNFVRGVPQFILMRTILPNLVISVLLFRRFRAFSRDFFRKQLNDLGILVCVRCGYDLRGQLDHRCPECGTEFDDTNIADDENK